MWRELFLAVAQLLVASPMAWKELNREKKNQNDFFNRFLYPIFGLIALASFIGGLWFTREGDLENALKNSIVQVGRQRFWSGGGLPESGRNGIDARAYPTGA